jgi:CRP-like cAMP-binding protein
MSERIYEFSALAVRYRIYAELLRMAGPPQAGGSAAVIRPFPTHAELASRLSTHREAVSRELSYLVRRGVIERRGDSLIVLDLARLSRMVDDARGKW